MEKLGKLILHGAGYTVLYLTIYFCLGGMIGTSVGATDIKIGIGKFFITLLFGYVIALTNFLFKSIKMKPWLSRLLAYAVSLLAFFCIIILGYRLNETPARVFVGLFLFTAFYFAIVGISALVRRTLLADSKNAKDGAKPAKNSKKEDKKEAYKPRYK